MKKLNLVFLPALMCDENLYSHQIQNLGESFNLHLHKDTQTADNFINKSYGDVNSKGNIHVFTIANFDNITKAAKYIMENLQSFYKNFDKEQFCLIGTSMGGYIATEIMSLYKTKINKLCLINTSWQTDTKEQEEQRKDGIKLAQQSAEGKFNPVTDKVLNNYFHNHNLENYNIVKQMATTLGTKGFINQQTLILSRSSKVAEFEDYNIDTLVIGGIYDKLTISGLHHEMCQALPKGKLVILDKCGHLSPLDQKVAITALLQLWLQI
ncbi:Alpha/beta hydrolase family protein [Candidatus Hepatincolaceae symbiont of Richtersius coronifer]